MTTIKKKLIAEYQASLYSKLTFSWLNPLVWLGNQRPLQLDDIDELDESDGTKYFTNTLQKHWNQELLKKNPSFWRAMSKTFGLRLYVIGIYWFIHDTLCIIAPLIMHYLLRFFIAYKVPDPSKRPPVYLGYLYAFLLFLCPALQTIFRQIFYSNLNRIDVRIVNGLRGVLYRKTMTISPLEKKQFDTGEISNLMSIDAEKIGRAVYYFHFAWAIPLNIIVTFILCWIIIGMTATILGFTAMLFMIPANWYIAKWITRANASVMEAKDKRSKLMNEILKGIRMIKMYAWETSFKKVVEKIRTIEYDRLKWLMMLTGVQSFLIEFIPVLTSLVTFSVYALMGYSLKSERVFTTLALFNNMKVAILKTPYTITEFINSIVSGNRIYKFLSARDVTSHHSLSTVQHDAEFVKDEEKQSLLSDEMESHDVLLTNEMVKITNGTFSWSKKSPPTLKQINMSVQRGQLISIIGEVGSGKSSLLSCLFGEMEKIRGSVFIKGKLAYCSQQPWIMNATVRENILLGKPYDHEKYQKVIKACALEPDFKIFPAGDFTEIGEGGTTLSGGQKHRIALARACYSDADVYLLDNVLCAVDAHVGKQIFQECICGLLAKKTRIFVTHNLQFVQHSDSVIMLHDGKITCSGEYSTLYEKNPRFRQLISTHVVSTTDTTQNIQTYNSTLPTSANLAKGKLIVEEDRETGTVKANIYYQYIIGYTIILLIILLQSGVFGQALAIGMDYWMGIWVSGIIRPDPGLWFYLLIYVSFALSGSVMFLVKSILIFVGSLLSSNKIHGNMLTEILRAPVSFFDSNPLGRILNRFTKDLMIIDNKLPITGLEFFTKLLQLLGVLIVVLFVTPAFIVIVVPVFIIYYVLQKFYRSCTRELSRLNSNTRSPIFAHFSETIKGATTIRAFEVQDAFIAKNEALNNQNTKVYFILNFLNRWIAFRTEFLGVLVVFGSALFAVIARDTVNPSSAGLSISYALTFTNMLNRIVRLIGDVEMDLVSVERTVAYSKLEHEAPAINSACRPPQQWPAHGKIQLKNVQMRYRKDLDPVLKNIYCDIRPGERIGVVGRTGSGKTSLTLALFRIVELCGGSIIIDGIDISKLGLSDLRSRLAIIPQDPTLFSGTLRYNLDPFRQYTDHQIWEALEAAHLKEVVMKFKSKLDEQIADSGENLSVGQRQLVCLARAILKGSKIVILDEATANVDMESDALIQKTVREVFKGCTTITIAHRLNTIIDCDRIMVLDSGKLVEFDTPARLMEKEDSIFSQLVKEAGMKNL